MFRQHSCKSIRTQPQFMKCVIKWLFIVANLWHHNGHRTEMRMTHVYICDVTTISISERFIFSCSHLHFAKIANAQSNISKLFSSIHIECWIQLVVASYSWQWLYITYLLNKEAWVPGHFHDGLLRSWSMLNNHLWLISSFISLATVWLLTW